MVCWRRVVKRVVWPTAISFWPNPRIFHKLLSTRNLHSERKTALPFSFFSVSPGTLFDSGIYNIAVHMYVYTAQKRELEKLQMILFQDGRHSRFKDSRWYFLKY